jgi:hypothetical protein
MENIFVHSMEAGDSLCAVGLLVLLGRLTYSVSELTLRMNPIAISLVSAAICMRQPRGPWINADWTYIHILNGIRTA